MQVSYKSEGHKHISWCLNMPSLHLESPGRVGTGSEWTPFLVGLNDKARMSTVVWLLWRRERTQRTPLESLPITFCVCPDHGECRFWAEMARLQEHRLSQEDLVTQGSVGRQEGLVSLARLPSGDEAYRGLGRTRE